MYNVLSLYQRSTQDHYNFATWSPMFTVIYSRFLVVSKDTATSEICRYTAMWNIWHIFCLFFVSSCIRPRCWLSVIWIMWILLSVSAAAFLHNCFSLFQMCSRLRSVSTSSLTSQTTTLPLLPAVMLHILTTVNHFLSQWRQSWINISGHR